ncbi:MAG: hypothetical protein ACI9FU_002408 [Granulosicoccus sp.]|jgi:hypothetical protein
MRIILNYLLPLAITSSLLIGCGGHSHNEEHNHEQNGHDQGHKGKDANDGCQLKFNSELVKMTWTAFKTTEKVGVGGTFDEVIINGTREATTAQEVFADANFEISVGTINSANPDRDKKISVHFFGSMISTLTLKGSVEEIADNYAVVSITMNGVSMKQKFNLKTENETQCTIVADLDLNNWNVQEELNALNEVCYDLHKGADGKSKLWPEVHVELTAELDKHCP